MIQPLMTQMYLHYSFAVKYHFVLHMKNESILTWKQFSRLYLAALWHIYKWTSALLQGGFGVRHLYYHFHLKPTRCAKGTTELNPQACPFRNDRVSQCRRVKAFVSHLSKHDISSILMVLFCFNYSAATDGLCSLLQNSRRPDRSQPQAICSLYPETKTHRGIAIHVPSSYLFAVVSLQRYLQKSLEPSSF